MALRARIALAVVGASLAVASLAAGVWLALQHEHARAAWTREAAELGSEGYDAARSDALYDEALASRAAVERAAWLAAIGVLVTSAAIGARPRTITTSDAAPLRAWAALALDASIAVVALVAIARVSSELGAAHAAFGALASTLGPAAVIATLGCTLAMGATPGARLARVRVHRNGRSPGVLRAAGAIALAPLALFVAPLALTIALARRRAPSPFHLAWVGLEACRRG